MRDLNIAIRSLFKRGRHNVTKIVSLSIGLAIGLVLIAKIYFEQSYDSFYPNADRIYRLTGYTSNEKESKVSESVSAIVAATMKEEVPGIEAATRLSHIGGDRNKFITSDKRRYSIGGILMADSCLFDVLPRPVLSGDPKKVLARPGYAMISRSFAEKLGGIDRAEGTVIASDNKPEMTLTIGGVFEDPPENSHLRYDVLVTLEEADDGGFLAWFGRHYLTYVLLSPGVTPETLRPAIDRMQQKHIVPQALQNAGVDRLAFFLKPIREVHTGEANIRNMTVMLAILAFALLFTAVMNYILIAISAIVNRSKEIALTKSYGASGTDIHRMTMSETLVHMILSLTLAVLLILACRDTVEGLLNVSLAALFFSKGAFILSGICAIVFFVTGFVPGMLFARIPVASAFRNFKENQRHWKQGLLFMEFTASALLVSLLIVIGEQHRHMLNSDPGYSYDRLAYCAVTDLDSTARTMLTDEIEKLPEVEQVSSCIRLPFGQMPGGAAMLPGTDQTCFEIADHFRVGDGFLALMEIPVVEGRSFTEEVSHSNEIMVSRSFVDRMKDFADWPDGAVGKRISITGHEQRDFTICGVYENYRIGSLAGNLDDRPSVMLYGRQDRRIPSRYLLVKFRRMTAQAVEKADSRLQELMPDAELELTLYSSRIAGLYESSRMLWIYVTIGGLITVIISLIGLIGYTNDEINRRRKEIAIRKINGASVRTILRIFLGDILRITLPAALLGCGISYFVSEYWQRQFAEKVPQNPLFFIAGGLSVCIIVTACVVYRTWKVANENPVNNLKSE